MHGSPRVCIPQRNRKVLSGEFYTPIFSPQKHGISESGSVSRRLQFKFQVGTQGPCTAMMRFYADPENEGYGDCDCPAMRNCIGRPRTFWAQTNKCYFIYSRVTKFPFYTLKILSVTTSKLHVWTHWVTISHPY